MTAINDATKAAEDCGTQQTNWLCPVAGCNVVCATPHDIASHLDKHTETEVVALLLRLSAPSLLKKKCANPECDNFFEVYPAGTQQCCSRDCSSKMRFNKRRAQKCANPECGKEFFVPQSEKTVCCSRSCGARLRAKRALVDGVVSAANRANQTA